LPPASLQSLNCCHSHCSQVSIPELKQRLQSEVDAESAKVSALSVEREDLLAARSTLEGTISDLQQKIQHANGNHEESQRAIADLQAQLHELTTDSQTQRAELASVLEGADASRNDLHVAALAAKTILDQLQMTNESSRDYGSTLMEVESPHMRSLHAFPIDYRRYLPVSRRR
jgi:septal ring factor EnvC (AmiA/AmiB activator)